MMKSFLLCLVLSCWCGQWTIAQNALPQHQLLKRKTDGLNLRMVRHAPPPKSEKAVPAYRKAKRKGNAAPEEALPKRVDPLVAPINRWHQYGPPYWNMTPTIEGEHCPVGCVALAQGQVMHYWKHPAQGEGEHTYNDSTGCGQVLTARFCDHQYEWNKMRFEYKEGTFTEEEAQPMELLLSYCGISVDMEYRRDASGAASVMQPISLTSYFGYGREAQIHFRDFYTREEITEMLKRELAAGRPILISGYNERTGHAFVIDGYNEDDWFHVMLGNPDGAGDGWTSLECMNGEHAEYDYTLSPESGMNLLQIFITGIHPKHIPAEGLAETHVYAMGGMTALNTQADHGDTLAVCVSNLANVGYNLHTDSVSLMLVQNGNIVCPLYTYDRIFDLEEIEDTAYTDTLHFTIAPDVEKGDYELRPMFRDEGGVWKAVRCCTGTPNYLLCHIDDSCIKLSSDTAQTATLTLVDIDIPDLITNGSAPDISITVKNNNAEATGRIYFLMEPTVEGRDSFYLYKQGYTLGADEVRTYRFCTKKIYAPKTGEYRLHILYENNLLRDEQMTELTSEDQPIYVSVLHSSVIQLAKK